MRSDRSPFELVVAADRLNPVFRNVLESPGYSPARALITEVFRTFDDADGNFVEQFQTTGFDARTWELYLYTYFCSAGFAVERGFPSPDFICEKEGVRVGIEAVTVGPTQGPAVVAPLADPTSSRDASEILDSQRNRLPIKLGSALYSKLQKRYWELPALAGCPLVLAVEAFHERASLEYSSAALAQYLFGDRTPWWYDSDGALHVESARIESHQSGTKIIPSGFFDLPDAEWVSAVLFSNSGTISKFNRMGHQGRYRAAGVCMVREGTCFDPDGNAVLPQRFLYEVGSGQHLETWGEGIEILHNPRARYPLLPRCLFPNATHLQKDERGVVFASYPADQPFIPIASLTYIFHEAASAQDATS